MSTQTIARIDKSIRIRTTPERAFDMFTRDIGTWWPKHQHSLDSENTETVVLEPRLGGKLFQRQKDGTIHKWGEVTAFERPGSFTLSWHIGREVEDATRVHVSFEDAGGGLTVVRLIHDGFENMASGDGADMREGYNNGWVNVFENHFANAFDEGASVAAE